MLHPHEIYMQRCIELARLGAGHVAPNPMVGAVLVHGEKIIGEGYHRQYGQPHAEVNCVKSVSPENSQLISSATLYVSLEPCAHFGKTPPCADMVIENNISRVVIGCRDPFEQVNGRGIERLQQAGVEVITGVLEKECTELNRRFFTWHLRHRPYILLKWAQTADRRVAGASTERLHISGDATNRLVHKWRSEETAILVGANTALLDDPSLTNRYWTGNQPVRLVLDPSLRLPPTLRLFQDGGRTVILNQLKTGQAGNLVYHQLPPADDMVSQVVQACYELQLQSILVEGGARLLQSFIDADAWDEIRVITNTKMEIGEGLLSPVLANAMLIQEETIQTDSIRCYKRVER